MANISDIIEAFLIEMLGENSSVNISRNELADYFSCAPSQINYVLTTRFTPARGFVIESRRGGGGFVNVMKVDNSKDELLDSLINISISEGLPYHSAAQILVRMAESGVLSSGEAEIAAALMSDKSLVAPSVAKDGLRAGMMRALAIAMLKRSVSGEENSSDL